MGNDAISSVSEVEYFILKEKQIMKRKLIAALLTMAIVVTGAPCSPCATGAEVVKADEIVDASQEVAYNLSGFISDKDQNKELTVGETIYSYADLVRADGSIPVYGEEWFFAQDSLLAENGYITDFYSDLDIAEAAVNNMVPFSGEIPKEAFGKFVYKVLWAYVVEEDNIYPFILRSDFRVTAWAGNSCTIVPGNDNKTGVLFSIYGDKLTSLKIASSAKVNGKTYKITYIGKNVLETASLKSITIPSSVTTIGEEAFSKNAGNLKTINIQGDLKKVEKNAFSGVNSKAVFKIKASKAEYDKIVKRIKKSGVPKKVTFKRVK